MLGLTLQEGVVQLDPGGEGPVESSDDHPFELGPGEAVRPAHQLGEIEGRGIAPTALEMQAHDRLPFDGTGEIDEEDLVETAPPQQLRRQALDVVAGGDEEHLTVPFL